MSVPRKQKNLVLDSIKIQNKYWVPASTGSSRGTVRESGSSSMVSKVQNLWYGWVHLRTSQL
jgi:hypothetical protein